MPERIGVIGLGVMGSAMSRSLLGAGHKVSGHDIDQEKESAAAAMGVTIFSSAGALAESSDLLVLSLPSISSLAEVSAEIAEQATTGLICLETGTFPLAAKFAARNVLSEASVELLDTPLSGTGLQAEEGTLVVFASGNQEDCERAAPVFESIGRSTHYLGEFGNGSRMKYIANLLVAVHNLATAEAHVLGMAAGMDPALVQKVMEDGVGSSKIFEIRGPMMVSDDYPAAARLDIIMKDGRLIKDFAEGSGALTPLLDAALPVYAASSEAGLGDLDAAALCRYLEKQSGITR